MKTDRDPLPKMYTCGHCYWPGPQTITCIYTHIATWLYIYIYRSTVHVIISMISIHDTYHADMKIHIIYIYDIFIWGLNLCRSFPSTRSWQELYTVIYPDTPRIWSAYLYILGDVDGKTTGNMPIDWVFGTGIITSQCCFMDSSKKHEPWRNLSGLILLSSAVTL